MTQSATIECPISSCTHSIPYTSNTTIYYIIEHCESDIDEWIAIEYNNIINNIGSQRIIFTNITEQQLDVLEQYNCYIRQANITYYRDSIVTLRQTNQRFTTLTNDNIVLTDMRTDIELHPSNTINIQYIILGGILGDNPPRYVIIHSMYQYITTVHTSY